MIVNNRDQVFRDLHKLATQSSVAIMQVMFVFLHIEKGTPFETTDQGKARFLTVWEQLDKGEQFSPSKKFLTTVPIVLYVLALSSHCYTYYAFPLAL